MGVGLSRWARAHGRAGFEVVEVALCPDRAAPSARLWRKLRGILAAGVFDALHVVLPDNSAAGPGAPEAMPGQQCCPLAGCASLLRVALRHRLMCSCEQLESAAVWRAPSLSPCLSAAQVQSGAFDLCAFGAVRTQRRRLCFAHVCLQPLLRRCTAEGLHCSFSDRKHRQDRPPRQSPVSKQGNLGYTVALLYSWAQCTTNSHASRTINNLRQTLS